MSLRRRRQHKALSWGDQPQDKASPFHVLTHVHDASSQGTLPLHTGLYYRFTLGFTLTPASRAEAVNFSEALLDNLRQYCMKRLLLIGAIIALYLLHQDFWFWRTSKPLVFGFLPIGLFYHLVYTLAVAALMWLLVKTAWPAHLETEVEHPVDRGSISGEKF